MKRRKVAATVLVALTLFLVVPGTSSAYTVPVYDYINWILSWYQRGQQIYNQGRQIYYAAKSLERIGQGAQWDSLGGLVDWLDRAMRGGEHLGYLVADLDWMFADTFPERYRTQSATSESLRRINRTRNTFEKLMAGLRRISFSNARSQGTVERLAVQSAAADTPLKAQESTNGWLNSIDVELQKVREAQLSTANAVTVYYSFELHRKAVADTARNEWIQAELPPPLAPDRRFYSGVPPGL